MERFFLGAGFFLAYYTMYARAIIAHYWPIGLYSIALIGVGFGLGKL